MHLGVHCSLLRVMPELSLGLAVLAVAALTSTTLACLLLAFLDTPWDPSPLKALAPST